MRVTVSTPSRLHFGLIRFEQSGGPSYGGLGMMIREPGWVLNLEAAGEWTATGPGSERAVQFARQALAAIATGELRDDVPQALRIAVTQAIPQHCGLGGGTQLGLAIAAGVRRLLNLPYDNVNELAAMVGRGQRSAVGSHGFLHGGLLWETGQMPGQSLGQLASRVALPDDWRIVLATPPCERGLSGPAECDAFRRLPPVPPDVTARLITLAEKVILPAAATADVEAFGEALHEYGRIAGNCFAAIQGGPHTSAPIAECVSVLRTLGAKGVGQSSWGPTVFAVVKNQRKAEQLAARLQQVRPILDENIQIVAPSNSGATVRASD